MKKALLIGINYYTTPSARLKGCIDDVVNMMNMLMDAYGYDLSDMVILRDDTMDLSILPTKQNILNALTTLVANSGNDTEFWFHYSGHGAKINVTKVQTDAIIVPCDYMVSGFILDNDLYDIFKNAKCRCFLIFDSCNSGNIVELPWTYEYKSSTQVVKTNVNNHILAKSEIYMFAGCKDTQTCADMFSVDEAEYVGAFTDAFLTCIRKRKHEPDLLTLYYDICIYLALNKFSQVPIFSTTVTNPIYRFVRGGSNITVNTNSNSNANNNIFPKIKPIVRLSKMIL